MYAYAAALLTSETSPILFSLCTFRQISASLIFAIQRCDPSPFYLFDEIDDALDFQYRDILAKMIREVGLGQGLANRVIWSRFFVSGAPAFTACITRFRLLISLPPTRRTLSSTLPQRSTRSSSVLPPSATASSTWTGYVAALGVAVAIL